MKKLSKKTAERYLEYLLNNRYKAATVRGELEYDKLDCYTVEMLENDNPYLMLESVSNGIVQAFAWNGVQYFTPVQIPLNQIDLDSLDITHFYKGYNIDYKGVSEAYLANFLNLTKIKLTIIKNWYALQQKVFNKRPLPACTRLDVLRDVLLILTTTENDSVDVHDILTLRYGYKWVRHPQKDKHRYAIGRMLHCLSSVGELEAVKTEVSVRYRATGLTYKTLEDSYNSDRINKSNSRLQKGVAVLTLAGVVMAAAQANVIKFPLFLDLSKPAKTCEISKIQAK